MIPNRPNRRRILPSKVLLPVFIFGIDGVLISMVGIAGHQTWINQGHPYLTDDAGADFSPKRSVAIVSAILFGAGIP